MFARPTSHISSRPLQLMFRWGRTGQDGGIKTKFIFIIIITQIDCQDYTCAQSGGQANDYLHKTFDFIATSDDADYIYDCSVNLTYTVDNTLHDNSFSCSGPWTRHRGRLFLFLPQQDNNFVIIQLIVMNPPAALTPVSHHLLSCQSQNLLPALNHHCPQYSQHHPLRSPVPVQCRHL